MNRTWSRRTFIQVGFAGLLAGCSTPSIARRRRRPSANEDLRIAVVGLRSKGWQHVEQLLGIEGARLVALCDADRQILEERSAEVKSMGHTAASFVDYRELLDERDLDGVILATPNHQHTLQTIWGCEAGVDVYVEKPVSHNLFESHVLHHVAARHGCIVQAGTQGRSNSGLVPAMEFIHGGGLGALKMIRGICYRDRASIGRTSGPQALPESVDYDLWCGPAEMVPLRRKRLHYDWHWVWPTGNGEIGNQGVHEIDMCRWALQANELPPRVFSFGGRFGYDDDAETPNTQLAWFDYRPAPIVFEVRGLPRGKGQEAMDVYRGTRVGIVVEGERGYFVGGQTGGRAYDPDGKEIQRFPGDGGRGHLENFLSAMRSRRTEDLTAPVAECATSSGLCHLANIAYRSGAASSPESIREQLPTSGTAAESMDRILSHLDQNKVDLTQTPLRAGGWLEWDASRWSFTGGPNRDAANQLISRSYRKGYEVRA